MYRGKYHLFASTIFLAFNFTFFVNLFQLRFRAVDRYAGYSPAFAHTVA